MDQPGNIKNTIAAKALLWVAVVASVIQFVLEPVVKMVLSVLGSPVQIPHFDSGAIWIPISGVLGIGTIGVVKDAVKLHDQRRNRAMTMQMCSNCPSGECIGCPVKTAFYHMNDLTDMKKNAASAVKPGGAHVVQEGEGQ